MGREPGSDNDHEDEIQLVPLGAIMDAVADSRVEAAVAEAAKEAGRARIPEARDAERAVIGAVFVDPEALQAAEDAGLTPEAFQMESLATIFGAMRHLASDRQPVDTLTVCDHLQRTGQLDACGGAAAISQLEAMLPTAAHAAAYASLVVEAHHMRQVLRVAHDIVQDVHLRQEKAAAVLARASASILDLETTTVTKSGISDRAEVVRRVMDALDRGETPVEKIPTGLQAIDDKIGGLPVGGVTVIGARPAMGKSAIATNIGVHISKTMPVAMCSLEMPDEEVIMREIASTSGFSIDAIRHKHRGVRWDRVASAFSDASVRQLHINATDGMTIEQIEAFARKMVKEKHIRALIIDHFHIIDFDGHHGDQVRHTLNKISNRIRKLAKRLGIAVLLLVQLNRATESRKEFALPQMSDIREVGALEQDARAILFLHRPEATAQGKEKPNPAHEGLAIVHIAKARDGETGVVRLRYVAKHTRFEDET
jgi:replicative DNA helicase